ncbi:MAG TPA: hypothetical protein VGL99_14605 [Chloroflexota bacterium]
MDSRSPTSSVLVWATRPDLAEAVVRVLAEPGRIVRVLEHDGELSSAHTFASLLVAEFGPRLELQQSFLRGPFVLIDPERSAPRRLASRAYAIAATASEAALAVDRFFEHRRLAQQAAGNRSGPRRCSRCGRGFDALKARTGAPSRRFVRFGSVALCGGCIEELRRLLRAAETAVVEADT